MPHSSITKTIERLREANPDASFIALGQTVLWDEPLKAVWRLLLDESWPDARLIAAVHDTDYFAKTTALPSTDEPYAVLPHNDGATRGLWSAAGELSTLFGSEDVPSRAVYESYGIPFTRLARSSPEGRARFQDSITEAWGWRGIIATSPRPPIARDVPLAAIAPALLEQLEWGFSTSLECIGPDARAAAQQYCQTILDHVRSFIARDRPADTLTDLYRSLLPLLYRQLLGDDRPGPAIDNSAELFRFDSSTHDRPRFAPLDLFLDTESRGACVDAYDRAVSGGGMYTLDTFGPGALPFDIVLPGRGRGTLRIDGDGVHIDWRGGGQRLCGPEPAWTRRLLARALECELGEGVALVGKAVSLIDMLASEFIVVFHETGSAYTDRTAAMNDAIRAAGYSLPTLPIVRLAYPTWDALATAGISTPLNLPPHLARAFGAGPGPIPASEFGARWRSAIDLAERQLKDARANRKPREVMHGLAALGGPDGDAWAALAADYEAAQSALRTISERTAEIKARIRELRIQIAEDAEARQHTERAKGRDFQATLRPLIEKRASGSDEDRGALTDRIDLETARRERTFDVAIDGCRQRIRMARGEIRRLRRQSRAIERSGEAGEHRGRVGEILGKLEMARVNMIRDAFLVSQSLPHTNARPSAWWIPLVDSSGAWLKAIAEGTRARLEEV